MEPLYSWYLLTKVVFFAISAFIVIGSVTLIVLLTKFMWEDHQRNRRG